MGLLNLTTYIIIHTSLSFSYRSNYFYTASKKGKGADNRPYFLLKSQLRFGCLTTLHNICLGTE